MASTLCLVLRGVSVAVGSARSIAEFFTRVSPHPTLCAVIVALREEAVLLGVSLALVPLFAGPQGFHGLPAFLGGLLGGAYAARAVLIVWYENVEDLQSPVLRLAILIPGGVSARAKNLLHDGLVGMRTRAVQYVTMGLIERAVRWCISMRR